MYGIWKLTTEIASKCPVRGVLLTTSGPLEPADIARRTGVSVEACEKAFALFLSPQVGWLEVVPVDELDSILALSRKVRDETRSKRDQTRPERDSSAADRPLEERRKKLEKEERTKTPQRRKRGEAAAVASEDVQQVFDTWNTIVGISVARELTTARTTAIKARLAEPFFREHWLQAIDRVRRSPFCQGAGERGWVACLDWFIKPGNVAKLLEGQYDQRAPTSPKQPQLGAGIAEWLASRQAEQQAEPPEMVLPFSPIDHEGGEAC